MAPLTKEFFLESTENCPVIPEIKNDEWLDALRESDSDIAYVLYGDICTIADIVERSGRQGNGQLSTLIWWWAFPQRKSAWILSRNIRKQRGLSA